ncbi:MAG TPA: SDR family NAD(P)-dependent oxidoreductase [Acidimicrobiaceae bacterium]|nr:SDR family NAD(P)-dependent oxidoreductase [Acidimicrobiaceae bacterium]
MPRFVPHPDRRPAAVTGASSGIGRAAALALAAAGHPVVLGARRLARLEEAAQEIRAGGGEAHVAPLDLADPGSVAAFVKAAGEAVGEIDVVVSAAGRNQPDSAEHSDPDDFATTVAVNLLGVQRLVGSLLPAMVRRAHGDVVFITSEVVRLPRVRNSGYSASKWGLHGYARTLQMELEGSGVRASIVQPGQTLSEMGSDWDPGVTTELLEQWVRWGVARHDHFLRPQAVAAAVMSVVQAPAGTQFSLVEVEPQAPLPARPRHQPPTGGGGEEPAGGWGGRT